jgi:hypothetical protein
VVEIVPEEPETLPSWVLAAEAVEEQTSAKILLSEVRHMPNSKQLDDVSHAIDELRARVSDARTAYGDIPAVHRLVNDVERIEIDARELVGAVAVTTPAAAAPPSPARVGIPIDDTPHNPSMWADADDEGVGGFHGSSPR